MTKVYPGGVHALAGVTLRDRRAASWSRSSARPARASPRCCTSSARSTGRPPAGSTIDGHDVSRLSDRQLSALRASRIGFVFQQFHLAAGVPALDNVADGLLYAGVPRRAPAAGGRRRWTGSGSGTGWTTGRTSCPAASGSGSRSPGRWSASPPLLLADEPTGNLDTASGARRDGPAARAARRRHHGRGHHARPRDRRRPAPAGAHARRPVVADAHPQRAPHGDRGGTDRPRLRRPGCGPRDVAAGRRGRAAYPADAGAAVGARHRDRHRRDGRRRRHLVVVARPSWTGSSPRWAPTCSRSRPGSTLVRQGRRRCPPRRRR